jgi:mRNA interferase RelE/StbE
MRRRLSTRNWTPPLNAKSTNAHALLSVRDDPKSLGKPLQANLSGLWRYRVGDYRIVAEIHDALVTILILSIKHRSIVYR